MFRLAALFILISLISSVACADDASSRVTRVELRSTVRLEGTSNTPTLGDVARINGEQAAKLSELAIELEKPIEKGAWSIIRHTTIRSLIKDAQGINEGGIVIVGPDVRITQVPTREIVRSQPSALEKKSTAPDYPTLRQQLERWTIDRLDTTPEQSRIRFHKKDMDDLNTPINGCIVEVREIGRSEQMLLGVVIYKDERVVLNRSFRFEVLIQRPVRVTTQQIRRSSVISHENSKIEQRWLSVAEQIADPDRAIGMITISTIDSGRMILTTNLEAPILVERGQLVNARSLAGSVSVSMLARSKQNGRLGDIIELESKDRTQQFHARVAGPRQVVILQPDQQSSKSGTARRVYP